MFVQNNAVIFMVEGSLLWCQRPPLPPTCMLYLLASGHKTDGSLVTRHMTAGQYIIVTDNQTALGACTSWQVATKMAVRPQCPNMALISPINVNECKLMYTQTMGSALCLLSNDISCDMAAGVNHIKALGQQDVPEVQLLHRMAGSGILRLRVRRRNGFLMRPFHY